MSFLYFIMIGLKHIFYPYLPENICNETKMEQISYLSRWATKKWHKTYKTKTTRIYMNIDDKS